MNWLKAFHSVDTPSEESSYIAPSSNWWEACCSISDVAMEHTSSKSESKLLHKQKHMKNFKWTAEEDEVLQRLVYQFKYDWEHISQYFPGKSPSQVSKRWVNKLDPNIKKTRWTIDEDDIVVNLVCKLGHNWKEISKHLEGRPPDAIKSRFYSNLKKRYQEINQGIEQEVDPDSFLNLDNVSTQPSAEQDLLKLETNCQEDSNTGNITSFKNCKLSLTIDQKRDLIRKLNKRVAKLQFAINSTSQEVKKLEEQMFPSESVI